LIICSSFAFLHFGGDTNTLGVVVVVVGSGGAGGPK
jgi:hypothetical protein